MVPPLCRSASVDLNCSSGVTPSVPIQEDDVIGVLNSKDIAQLLPIGDRILIQVRQIGFRPHLLKCTGSNLKLCNVCSSLALPLQKR